MVLEMSPREWRGSVSEGDAIGQMLGHGTVNELVGAALLFVVALAEATIDLADGASVSLFLDDELTTVAASNDLVSSMDADQYRLGEGPCVSAATTGALVRTDSIADETRWPAFVARAARRGLGSVISTPIVVLDRAVGALNVCSRSAWAFEAPEERLAAVIAAQISAILTARASDERSVAEISRTVQLVLIGRRSIMLAQGILIERDGISADDAHSLLRGMSRATNTGLALTANEIVRSAEHATPPRSKEG